MNESVWIPQVLLALGAAGLGIGIALRALERGRRHEARLDNLTDLLRANRQDLDRLSGLVLTLEREVDELEPAADLVEAIRGGVDHLLAFLDGNGLVDDPGPEGFLLAYDPIRRGSTQGGSDHDDDRDDD